MLTSLHDQTAGKMITSPNCKQSEERRTFTSVEKVYPKRQTMVCYHNLHE